MSLFKANYGYNSAMSFTPKQAKKKNENAKERIEKLMTLYKELCKLAKLV